MAEAYDSGPSEGAVAGASQSLAELTSQDYMALPPKEGDARPAWMVTRFPVSMEEYRRLNEAAQEPDPVALDAELDPAPDVDESLVEAEDLAEDADPGGTPDALAPAVGHSFEGLTQTAFRPPDCTMAVGPNDVLVAVNVDLAGFRKDGSLRFRWPSMTALFQAVLPAGAGLFDPKLAFDHYSQRWIAVVAARRGSPAGSWLMLGVSQGPDPAGAWWVWALDAAVDGSTATNNWADYPMLGFDTQAIYVSTNQFQVGGGFQYSKLRILNKSEAYTGSGLRWWDFWNLKNPDNSLAFTVQAAAHFRGVGGNPPAHLVNALWPSGNTLTLWRLSDPIALWAGRAPVLERWSVACRAYDLPPDAEQPNTSTRVETNDSRLLSAVYQHAGGVRRLWTTHTSKITWSGESAARSAVQWYEIDVDSRNVVQQNGYGATGRYYYFPVIQTDISRNAYLTFTRSGASELAALRQTGRRVGAPAHDLEGSRQIKAGESTYTGGRWGDYFGHARDGGDAGRVWLYGQYADAGNTWGSWVHSAKF